MIYWYEQDKNTAVIKFYANIEWWYNNASSFTALFEALDAKYATIIIRCHCYGGNVFEGNAIYNCIGAAQANVIWRIEGICASMGSIIMLSCGEIEMCENGILMIHEPSGGAYGNEKDLQGAAKMLGIMKKNAAKSYAQKMGIAAADFSAEYFDGYDHWLSAEDALELGLITRVIPSVVKDVKKPPIPEEAEAQGVPADIQNIYSQYGALASMKVEGEQAYKEGMQIKKPNARATAQGKTKPNIEMNKKELIARFGLTGVDENTPDEQIYAAIEAKGKPAPAAPAAPATAPQSAQPADANEQQAEALLTSVEAITGKAFDAEQRKSLLEIGKAGGVSAMQAAMKLMVPAASAAPAGAKVPQAITYTKPGASSSASGSEDRKDWTYDTWAKKDPRGLEKMEKEELEKYNTLYLTEFGELPVKA
ncbi:hypothetical protein CAP35_13790 [Chitinophagaceae bacterium IBVUCB1]|nr:hypothetical protein CAP35_13790 [Chitinophagaceae bacterium IBVUCB1]